MSEFALYTLTLFLEDIIDDLEIRLKQTEQLVVKLLMRERNEVDL